MEINRLFTRGNSLLLLLFFVSVAFVFCPSVLVNLSVYFFTGSKISILCQKFGKKFIIQIRTNYTRRPKKIVAENGRKRPVKSKCCRRN